MNLKILIGQGYERKEPFSQSNLFFKKFFCQEKNLFILVVELLHRESPHSEAFSLLFQAEAPRGSSSVLWEDAGGQWAFSRDLCHLDQVN